jgi:hypothetical protein
MKALPLAVTLALCAGGAALVSSQASAAPVCFSPREIQSTTPISDREIVFKLRNGKSWKNTLAAKCPGLKFEGGFSWTIHGDTVCENMQSLTVLRRGNTCLLGKFEPYEEPAQE